MKTRTITALALLAAALTGGVASAGDTASGSKPPPPQVGGAKLEFVVKTTSDWTQIRLNSDAVLDSSLTGIAGAGKWTSLPNGINLVKGNANHFGTATDTAVVQNLTPDKPVKLALKKGFDGVTKLTIYNLNSGTPKQIAVFTDSRHSYSDSSNRKDFSVSAAKLFGDTAIGFKRADSRKLVLAFYYPWFGGYGSPKLADVPSDPRSTESLTDVESMTEQARDNGINGFIVSWDGVGSTGHSLEFGVALRAAEAEHQLISGYVESVEASRTKHPMTTELNWIAELLKKSKSPAFLTSGHVPDIFVYQMGRFSPAQWATITEDLRTKDHDKFHLIGDETAAAYLPFEWGVHQYAATANYDKLLQTSVSMGLLAKAPEILGIGGPKLYAATVSPGYDDRKLRGKKNPVVSRDGGKRFDRTWVAAVAGRPDWILVTSWNEWYEDTQIEPGVKNGSLALAQTHEEAHVWRAES